MKYRIAIVTINLNNQEGLAATIASVGMQHRNPHAYVVVDGGSNDGSIDCILANQKTITHWISEADEGVYQAQNKGWRMVEADYYLFLNSGDTFYEANSLYLLEQRVSSTEQIVYGNLAVKNGDGSIWNKTYPAALPANYFDYETLPHPATLISRYWLLKMNGYDERLRICSDWKFFLEVFRSRPTCFRHSNHVISCFEANGISSQEKNAPQIEQEKQRIRKELGPPPRRLFARLRGLWH